MSVIPPLLSESPPPPPTAADEIEEDEEFGDFIGSREEDGFDGFESSSCQASPDASPQKLSIPKDIDINSNLEGDTLTVLDLDSEKGRDLESPIPEVDLENSKNEINSLTNVNIPYLTVTTTEDDLNETCRNLTSSIIDALKLEESEIHESKREEDVEENDLQQKEEIKHSQEDTFYEFNLNEKEDIKESQDVTPEFNSFDSYEPEFNEIVENHLEEEPNYPGSDGGQKEEPNDDFADFTEFTAGEVEEEDDFGEFASSSADLFESEVITEEEAYDRAKRMFEIAFPPFETTCEDCLIEEIEKGSQIFEMLKDITDTPALSMQWAKSSSQKLLLKALSIDERNILPSWTSSTPIFASNLSLQPLEPVKTESPTPVPVAPLDPIKAKPEEVPSIKFDWNPPEGNSPLETDLDDKKPQPPEEPKPENIDLSIFDEVPSIEGTLTKTVKPGGSNNSPEDTNTYGAWLDTFTVENDFSTTVETKNRNEEFTRIVEEDEFTDFQSSLPEKNMVVPPPPLTETLTPTPVYQTVTNAPPTSINWPDPGITDEDIRKLEEAFSKPIEEKEEFPRTVPEKPRQPSEEEWSDFISASNKSSSPLHKLSRSDKERTSSPDLPLSVFNLGSIQPAKQPIPVITSQGLVQTKLSANRGAAGGLKQYFNFGKQQQKTEDDDEWGEFVSSNALPQDPSTLNGYRRQGNNSIFSQYHHRSVSEGGKGVMAPALPELDFIAPKSRTSSGRKK